MRQECGTRGRRDSAGFSLVELLVVAGIIAILTVVAIPNLRGYLRTSQIRSAASQLASDLGTARAKAIGKNVHFGVVFVIVSNNTYRNVTEDDIDRTNGYTGTRLSIPTVLSTPTEVDVQASPLRTLPQGVVFCTPTAAPPACAAAGTNSGIRFSAFGVACNPDVSTSSCPAVGTGVNHVRFGTDFRIRLYQPLTGLYKTIAVEPGGRIMTLPGFAP